MKPSTAGAERQREFVFVYRPEDYPQSGCSRKSFYGSFREYYLRIIDEESLSYLISESEGEGSGESVIRFIKNKWYDGHLEDCFCQDWNTFVFFEKSYTTL